MPKLDDAGVMDYLAFKGGTCLRKSMFGSAGRFSEDLDFTLDTDRPDDDVLTEIVDVFNREHHGISFTLEEYYKTDAETSFGGDVHCRHSWNDAGRFRLQVSLRERPTLPVVSKAMQHQAYFDHVEFELFDVRALEIASDPSRGAPVRTSPADVTFQRRAARSPPPTGGASRSEPEPHIEANHPRAKPRPRQPAAEPGPPFREVLVVRTHADTDGAIAVLSNPEAEALLGVDGPLGNTDEVGAVVNAVARRVVRDRFHRACVGAPLTNVTKLLDAERSWLVMGERQVREDLAEPHSRAELFRN